MNPQFRTLAIVIGALLGLLVASYASGWPSALWGGQGAGTHSQQSPQTTPAVKPLAAIEKQLADAGYTKTSETSHFSGEANRTITDQKWTRSQSPELVVLSDDLSNAPGKMLINSIESYGADGKGNATCAPSTATNLDLTKLLVDVETFRKNNSAGGLAVSCLK